MIIHHRRNGQVIVIIGRRKQATIRTHKGDRRYEIRIHELLPGGRCNGVHRYHIAFQEEGFSLKHFESIVATIMEGMEET